MGTNTVAKWLRRHVRSGGSTSGQTPVNRTQPAAPPAVKPKNRPATRGSPAQLPVKRRPTPIRPAPIPKPPPTPPPAVSAAAPVAAPKRQRQVREKVTYSLHSGNIALTVTQILDSYRSSHSWKRVARRFGVLPAELREWVNTHQADFVGHSAELADLITSEDPPPGPPRAQIPPDDTSITVDTEIAVAAHCTRLRQTAAEVFHQLIDDDQRESIAREIGITPVAFVTLVGRHGGIVFGHDLLVRIRAYCQKHNCSMEELCTDFDQEQIAKRSRQLGIFPQNYLQLVKFFRGSLVPSPT